MKKLFPLFFTLIFSQLAFAQNPEIMKLQAHWDDDNLPIASPGNLNLQYNSVFGMAVNGHEIAVLGNARFILFFDVTNPTQIQKIGQFEGAVTTIWREFKAYKNRIYAVSDGTEEGLMIFDLSKAPTEITRSYWSNEFFNSSHSIMLDTVSGHIYLNGCSASPGGITVLDVSQNPDKPTLLASVPLVGGYIHDSYVRGDTLYASSGYNGYYIYDMKTDPKVPKALASISTGGYNHNSWLTLDGRYAYYTEEIPRARPIQIVDLQNLANGEIEIVGSFLHHMTNDPAGPQAIAHNVYIRDNWLFDSQYEDGLLVYDITDPLHPVFKYWYDTHPENAIYNGYYGCWGNYPWLPSGTILASDMQNGLYVLTFATGSSSHEPSKNEIPMTIWPNPTVDKFCITISAHPGWTYRLLSLEGKVLAEGQTSPEVDVSRLAAGVYFIEIQTIAGDRAVRKFVKQ